MLVNVSVWSIEIFIVCVCVRLILSYVYFFFICLCTCWYSNADVCRMCNVDIWYTTAHIDLWMQLHTMMTLSDLILWFDSSWWWWSNCQFYKKNLDVDIRCPYKKRRRITKTPTHIYIYRCYILLFFIFFIIIIKTNSS